MKRMSINRLSGVAGLVLALGTMPGCIVQDIHDEIAKTNASIVRVEGDMARTNTAINEVQEKLSAIELTNQKLDQTREALAVLESIDKSLKRLDEHLASLRATINNIDSVIPLLGISGDKKGDAPADPNAPVSAPAEGGKPESAPAAPVSEPKK